MSNAGLSSAREFVVKFSGFLKAFLLSLIALPTIGPVSANDRAADAAPASAADTVQSMMDKLYPRIEKAAFTGSEKRKRLRASLGEMISEGMQIDFNARILECDEPALFTCQIANSSDALQRSMVIRYANSFMKRLGLSGSGMGNLPLPEEARQREGVDHWINWSQCYQPPSYPENAISCERASHPFSQPSPGVRAVFETNGDKVIAIHFYITDLQTIRNIRSERRKLAVVRK